MSGVEVLVDADTWYFDALRHYERTKDDNSQPPVVLDVGLLRRTRPPGSNYDWLNCEARSLELTEMLTLHFIVLRSGSVRVTVHNDDGKNIFPLPEQNIDVPIGENGFQYKPKNDYNCGQFYAGIITFY